MGIAELFDLSGRVAVITGGHSGIGKGISEGLAEAGADIVVCARRFDRCQEACSEIEKKTGRECLPVKCDVASTAEVDNLIDTAVKKFGKVDILVNSAGVGGSEKPVVEMSDDDWDTGLNINLRGAFLCSRAAAREMIKQNGGRIINIASIYASLATRNMAAYCASKGGLVQLTRVMALELVKHNINVNVICPGYFYTPMNYEFFDTEAGKKLAQRNIPMQRLGSVDELKGIAIYLASPASSFTTGATVMVDGGQSLW